MRKITLILCGLLLCACASRQAGVMIGKAQGEITQFSNEANKKVKKGEDRQLEFELKDLVRKAHDFNATPEQIVAETQARIAEHDARLVEWMKNSSLIQNAAIELSAAANYHGTGITAADAISALSPIVDQLVSIYTKPVIPIPSPTPKPMPVTP